ncbi:hypothetical protein [Erwinia sp. ErVv1]|nr:hypothetical protein [Erwinia sp. ErVv1]
MVSSNFTLSQHATLFCRSSGLRLMLAAGLAFILLLLTGWALA